MTTLRHPLARLPEDEPDWSALRGERHVRCETPGDDDPPGDYEPMTDEQAESLAEDVFARPWLPELDPPF